MRNATANHLAIADVTSNFEEVFENAKTLESKSESGTITTNATNEIKYVKPKWHTGYVFIVEDMLVVASSMAKAIELYCEYKKRKEKDIINVQRISNGKTCILDTNYDALIEG